MKTEGGYSGGFSHTTRAAHWHGWIVSYHIILQYITSYYTLLHYTIAYIPHHIHFSTSSKISQSGRSFLFQAILSLEIFHYLLFIFGNSHCVPLFCFRSNFSPKTESNNNISIFTLRMGPFLEKQTTKYIIYSIIYK